MKSGTIWGAGFTLTLTGCAIATFGACAYYASALR
jgi:hypothetical protein